MGRKKITVDQLEAEISDILQKYADNVNVCVDKVAVQYAKIGKRKLETGSPKRTGHYAKGWAYMTSHSAGDPNSTLYHKTAPSLTHLLEHGHAKRNGGRTKPIVHVAPVEQEIIEEFTNTLKNEIGGI